MKELGPDYWEKGKKELKKIDKNIKKPPIIVVLFGISLIPKIGNQTQNIPPITSVKDNSVNSAAGIAFDPIEYKIKPKQTNEP